MITIHDGNWSEFAEKIQARDSRLCGLLPRSQAKQLYAGPSYAEVVELIPRSKWASRYDAMIGKFARQRKDRFNPIHHNQGPHPICWRYSLAQHLECARSKMNLPYRTLGPESIKGTFGWADEGSTLDDAMEFVVKNGMATRDFIPQYEFNPNRFKPGWQEAAKDCVPLEFYRLGSVDMYDETVSALLNGDAVWNAVNFMAHAMDAEELQKHGNEFGIWERNSWQPDDDMLLLGRQKIFRDAYVVREVTYSR